MISFRRPAASNQLVLIVNTTGNSSDFQQKQICLPSGPYSAVNCPHKNFLTSASIAAAAAAVAPVLMAPVVAKICASYPHQGWNRHLRGSQNQMLYLDDILRRTTHMTQGGQLCWYGSTLTKWLLHLDSRTQYT